MGCKNCGFGFRYKYEIRYCVDCWKMIFKVLAVALIERLIEKLI